MKPTGVLVGTVILLSEPVRWLWTGVFLAVVISHCAHAVADRGESGAWHAGHVVMAFGMVAMFVPNPVVSIPNGTMGVFVCCALAVLAWLCYTAVAGRPVSHLWAFSLADMAAMAYMLGSANAASVTAGLAAYFVCVAVAWLCGALDDGRTPSPAFDTRPKAGATPVAGTTTLGERVTFAAMATGMAYMFVAMWVGP